MKRKISGHSLITEALMDPRKSIPDNWVDLVFEDYPFWDAQQKAPLEIYSFYHTICIVSDKTEMGKDKVFQDFMATKAESFGLITHENARKFMIYIPTINDPRNFEQIQNVIEQFFTREALMAIGI